MAHKPDRVEIAPGRRGWKPLLVFCLMYFATPLFADVSADLDKKTNGVNFTADYNIPVDKSDTLKGTDFGTGYRAGIYTFTGKGKAYGMGLRYDQSNTIFTQALGSMKTEWVDFAFGYRIFMFYPTVILGSGLLTTYQNDIELVHAIGVTRGGGLGIRYAVGSVVVIKIDTASVSVAQARDGAGRDVALGPRTDVDFGVVIKLPWEPLDIITGMRYRTYKITVDDVSNDEVETGPYVGFNIGFSP